MPTSGSSGRDNRVRPHDHSSDETGGDVLRPKHLASKQFPVVDVRAYGVEGDGETDDAVAFQRAVDAATPNGVLYVPYNVDLHFESPVDVDLGLSDAAVESDDPPQTPFSLICEGTLNPAPGLGTAVHIHHGHFPYVRVRVQGGGADLSDTAIRVSDVVGGLYEGFATDYSGVVYKFDNGGTVTRGVSVGTLNAQAVGQALLMEAGPAGEMLGGEEGIGEVYDIWDGVPTRGIEFRNVRGLSLNQYENAVDARFGTEQSMVVEGCEDVAIDKVAVGGIGSEFPLVVYCRTLELIGCTVI